MEKIKKSLVFFAICIILVDIIGGIGYAFYYGMYGVGALHCGMALAISPLVYKYFNFLKP